MHKGMHKGAHLNLVTNGCSDLTYLPCTHVKLGAIVVGRSVDIQKFATCALALDRVYATGSCELGDWTDKPLRFRGARVVPLNHFCTYVKMCVCVCVCVRVCVRVSEVTRVCFVLLLLLLAHKV